MLMAVLLIRLLQIYAGEDRFTYQLRDDSEEGFVSEGQVTIQVRENQFDSELNNANTSSFAPDLDTECEQLRDQDRNGNPLDSAKPTYSSDAMNWS